jgi:hypothetical protein
MSCPHGNKDCTLGDGAHHLLHYRCRTCINEGCEKRVGAMGANECSDCVMAGIRESATRTGN